MQTLYHKITVVFDSYSFTLSLSLARIRKNCESTGVSLDSRAERVDGGMKGPLDEVDTTSPKSWIADSLSEPTL